MKKKITEFIKEECKGGVEWKKLGEVCEMKKGQGLSKADKGSGDVPIILYGELYTTYGNYITKVVSSAAQDRIGRAPLIKRGDLLLPLSSTTKEAQIGKASAYALDEEAYLGGDALLLRHQQNSGYLTHLLNGSWFEKLKMRCVKGTTINHLDYHKMLEIPIPVPPLSVQEVIVDVLDKFTELEKELEKELELRKKQYGYYRDKLLTFGEGVKRVRLGEVCEMKRGTSVTKKTIEEGDIPVISGGVQPAYYCNTYNRDGETITVAGSGAGAGYVQYWNKPIFVCDAFSIKGNENLLTKYVYYVLTNMQGKIYATKKGAGVPHVHISSIENFEIPIPSIAEQERVVRILDKFEALTTVLQSGIPAEIEARRKQYAYYRDKLLSFEGIGVDSK